MLSRRVIWRTLFALPIVLCLAGWLWSSTHLTAVGYQYGDRGVQLWTWAGALRFEWVVGSARSGWIWINRPLDRPEFWPSKPAFDGTWLLGLSYGCYDSTLDYYYRYFGVPYWFLLVVCGGVFAWVWRKTRRKPAPSAFPVEVAAEGGQRGPPEAPRP